MLRYIHINTRFSGRYGTDKGEESIQKIQITTPQTIPPEYKKSILNDIEPDVVIHVFCQMLTRDSPGLLTFTMPIHPILYQYEKV